MCLQHSTNWQVFLFLFSKTFFLCFGWATKQTKKFCVLVFLRNKNKLIIIITYLRSSFKSHFIIFSHDTLIRTHHLHNEYWFYWLIFLKRKRYYNYCFPFLNISLKPGICILQNLKQNSLLDDSIHTITHTHCFIDRNLFVGCS